MLYQVNNFYNKETTFETRTICKVCDRYVIICFLGSFQKQGNVKFSNNVGGITNGSSVKNLKPSWINQALLHVEGCLENILVYNMYLLVIFDESYGEISAFCYIKLITSITRQKLLKQEIFVMFMIDM